MISVNETLEDRRRRPLAGEKTVSKNDLHIGAVLDQNGKPHGTFRLPLDLVTRTMAVIGIRGSGKTCTAAVIAEEMCEAGLPWVALDSVGVWWGLRCEPDGTPGGYPVVIIGGEHADIPLTKGSGAAIADAIINEHLSCMIDLSGDSKNTFRHFVAEFCDRLMELRPATPRHIFIEEAPELVPQKPMGEQKRSLSAVDRLIRLGRNRGYGATLISQRTATIQKDVLTQCESLIAHRSIGKPDRKAMMDWIAEVTAETNPEETQAFMESLTSLPSGTGWFWSPQWMGDFYKIMVRPRKTFHPGATRTAGHVQVKQVRLSDIRSFVDRFSKALNQAPVKKGAAVLHELTDKPVSSMAPVQKDVQVLTPELEDEIVRLRNDNSALRQENMRIKSALASVRKYLGPQYDLMNAIFRDLNKDAPAGAGDDSVWRVWKEKLGTGASKVITILQERGPQTRVQLKTLAGYSRQNMANIISALNSNQLIEKDGDTVRLRNL